MAHSSEKVLEFSNIIHSGTLPHSVFYDPTTSMNLGKLLPREVWPGFAGLIPDFYRTNFM